MNNNYQTILEFQNFCAKRAYELALVDYPSKFLDQSIKYIKCFDTWVECVFETYNTSDLNYIDLSIELLNLNSVEWSAFLQTKKDVLDAGKKRRQKTLDDITIESNLATIQRLQQEIDEINEKNIS